MPTTVASWAIALALILVSVPGMARPGVPQAADNAAICRQNPEGQTWTLTITSRDEARAHLATHPSDGQPYHPVPGQSGYLFDADCNPVAECSCIALGNQPLWGSESISDDCLRIEEEITRMIQVANLAEIWYLSGQWYLTEHWLRNPSKDTVLPSRRRTCPSTH